MRAIDAYEELRRLVTARSIQCTEERGSVFGRGEDARAAWQAFQSLMTVPAGEPFTTRWGVRHLDQDLLMFEPVAGEPEMGDDGLLFLLFTRQFSFADADGEYSHMNQLTLEVQALLPPELAGVRQPVIWGAAGLPEPRSLGPRPATSAPTTMRLNGPWPLNAQRRSRPALRRRRSGSTSPKATCAYAGASADPQLIEMSKQPWLQRARV